MKEHKDVWKVHKVRSDFGHDRAGYDGDLLRNGRKVAYFGDDGWGGEMVIDWDDAADEDAYREYCSVAFADTEYADCLDVQIENMVNDVLNAKRLVKDLRTKVVFTTTTDGPDTHFVFRLGGGGRRMHNVKPGEIVRIKRDGEIVSVGAFEACRHFYADLDVILNEQVVREGM
jgi:hypothetical protein